MAEEKYRSTVDAVRHILIIRKELRKVIDELENRSRDHDKSKLTNPEKACYDKYIPMLKEVKYGTAEYYDIKEAMQKEGLDHHYQVNRHHPEHFENGVMDMDLVDVLEMLCDWYAASQRSDTGFEAGFESNCRRFGIPDYLKDMLWRTYETYLAKEK